LEQHCDASAAGLPAATHAFPSHVPCDVALSPMQFSEQHSRSASHELPGAVQNPLVHFPLAQSSEQHCSSVVQDAPLSMQLGVGESPHLPPTQAPVQHSLFAVQVCPGSTHPTGSTQIPPAHWSVQQSPGTVHVSPTLLHDSIGTQTLFVHAPEQQSSAESHAPSSGVQVPSGTQAPA
jgi:hypothetical protein